MKQDLYTTVTAKILAELETGAAPWVKPWKSRATAGIGNRPRNAATGRAYSGINVLLLWSAQQAGNYVSAGWLTFKQAIDAGGNVRKGEKGTGIVFVSTFEKQEENSAGELEDRRIPFLKSYTVFNVEQCENLPAKFAGTVAPIDIKTDAERVDLADEFLAATGADIQEGNGEAYYMPGADKISMPRFEAFNSADSFYGTAFHELAHWTGHKTRLDRDFSGRFGTKAYAAEELVAELTAAFLCAEFEMDGELRHAGYLQTWIGLLKDDKRAFFTAAAKAQKAADFLRGLALAEPAAAPVDAIAAPAAIIMPAPIAAPVAAYQAPIEPATEPTAQGLQYVMPGCAKDRSRQAAAQFDLF